MWTQFMSLQHWHTVAVRNVPGSDWQQQKSLLYIVHINEQLSVVLADVVGTQVNLDVQTTLRSQHTTWRWDLKLTRRRCRHCLLNRVSSAVHRWKLTVVWHSQVKCYRHQRQVAQCTGVTRHKTCDIVVTFVLTVTRIQVQIIQRSTSK